MASIPPGDPHRDIAQPAEPTRPRAGRDDHNRAGLATALTIVAALIVVLLIVLL
jgi:hypothetical protein